jgi:hypothetical protein
MKKKRNDGTVKYKDSEYEKLKEEEALNRKQSEEEQLNMWIGYLIRILNNIELNEHEKSTIENSNNGVIIFRYFILERNDPINIYKIYILNKFNNTPDYERMEMLSKLPTNNAKIGEFSETTKDKLVIIPYYKELINNIMINYITNLNNLIEKKRKREETETEIETESKKLKTDGRKRKKSLKKNSKRKKSLKKNSKRRK